MMEASDFLESVRGYMQNGGPTSAANKPPKIASIDPAFTISSGFLPRVTFEGETVLSGKMYPYVGGYVPRANDRVLLLPIGTTYVIVASIANSGRQGFSQDVLANTFWTYFSSNSYVEAIGSNANMTLGGRQLGTGLKAFFYYTGGTAGLTAAEAALAAWTVGSDASMTWKNGYVYQLFLHGGVYDNSSASTHMATVRVRKTINSLPSQQLVFTRVTTEVGVGLNVPNNLHHWGYVKNVSGADIVSTPGLTVERVLGAGSMSLYGDASLPTSLSIMELGLASQLTGAAGLATAIV